MPTSQGVASHQGSTGINYERQAEELGKLLSIVRTPPSKNQISSTDPDKGGGKVLRKSLQWPVQLPQGGAQTQQSTEATALEQFSLSFQSERKFTNHKNVDHFTKIFSTLVKQRLNNVEWTDQAPPENVLRVLVCLRILMRDPAFQKEFSNLGGVKVLSQHLQKATDSYLAYGDGPFVVDILKEMTNIFQKLSAVVEQREWIIACGAHKALVLLLSADELIVLHCTLHALISLAQSARPRSLIAELNSIEILLQILQEYDMLSKKLAANLLRLLCSDSQAREMMNVHDAIPLLLSLLHSDSVTLLWNVVWCLVQMSSDSDASNDIRLLGGIPLLLSLLHERKFVSDRVAASGVGSASAALKSPAILAEEEVWSLFNLSGSALEGREAGSKAEELKEHQMSLKAACCTCLTELMVNDTNAQQIVQSNGVYLIGLLIMPPSMQDATSKYIHTLQANAFRAMRFLFSMERNRRLFKRLFPPDLFEMFIDIGHYNRNLDAYLPLVAKINCLPQDSLDEIHDNIDTSNQNKGPTAFIGEYAVLELLGTGGFGSVYKVCKNMKATGRDVYSKDQSYLAMKEINTLTPVLGKSNKERDKSVGQMISELTIIKEQLRHPNIVRYYKTFVEQDKLYIVMELIEGAPIGEYVTSLKEKGERFSEERVWRIFVQLVLALRYLHKEKGIVHRDLSPNNIMLGENDKVTITDFGLAKQKQKDCSKMTSVVGTILYSCPEIVQSQPYTEKADIWAIGCILYQMCTLKPPFYSNNMLTLATKIVEADYEPIPEVDYSEKVRATVGHCISADSKARPDVVQLAANLSDVLLMHMDSLHKENVNLEKRLDKERRRTQKHFNEANRNMQNYHRLFLVSQERYDKLVNLASSGGANSIKDESELREDNVFTDQDLATALRKYQRNSSSTSNGTDLDEQTGNDNGFLSDDEEFCCSSGSESRESSAGKNGRSVVPDTIVPRPPGQGTPRSRRKPTRSAEQYSQALTLDIPMKVSRDSGISSGDPSPNANSPPSSTDSSVDGRGQRERPKSFSHVQRSPSNTSLDTSMKRAATSATKTRPNSAGKATLTISPRKVRQISDPILQMLHILHKIIFITQLPPTLCHNPRRRIIERFKRALFNTQSTSMNLKNELKKLLNGSRELIDLNFGPCESLGLARQASRDQEHALATSKSGASVYDTEAEEVGITYEQMTSIIESVLVESGYYDMSPSARHRTNPLTPIGAVDSFLAKHRVV